MAAFLLVKEIYLSLQGESTWAGLPCVFVRLSGCDLRCSYCDSVHAFRGGERMNVEEILRQIEKMARKKQKGAGGFLPLVEITGGEPLLQSSVFELMHRLCEKGYQVLLETSGAHCIGRVDARVCKIVDLKCPSSGETHRMKWGNINHLSQRDEVKFVIASEEDYDWAKCVLRERRLWEVCQILFSSAMPLPDSRHATQLKSFPAKHRSLSRKALAECIIADCLPVRFQLQMHKFIWHPNRIGV